MGIHGYQLLYLVISASHVLSTQLVDYEGYQVWRIQVPEERELEKLLYLKDKQWHSTKTDQNKQQTAFLEQLLNSENIQIWRYSNTDQTIDIPVSPREISKIHHILKHHNLNYNVTVSNLGRLITDEQISNRRRRKRDAKYKNIIHDITDHYARHDEIQEWMEGMAELYPEIVSIIDLGQTGEGRTMSVLKLGIPGRHKWKVWIDGGIHAREWISPATVLHLAKQLIEGYTKNDIIIKKFLQNLDWYILPVVNPDGYEYTHTEDRLWRKNRKPYNGTSCHGVDLNRNWQFQWGKGHSSSEPCEEVYKGSSPGSEEEVRNIENFLFPRGDAFIAFITYHSYGQRFITRWDYSNDVIPEDHEQLMSLAVRAVDSMQEVHGATYEAGRAPQLMYPYGGGSPDWARAISNIKYSYLVELRDQNSFIMPADQIAPTGEENWAALKVIADDIVHYYGDILAPHFDDPPSQNYQEHFTMSVEAVFNDASLIFVNKLCLCIIVYLSFFISSIFLNKHCS